MRHDHASRDANDTDNGAAGPTAVGKRPRTANLPVQLARDPAGNNTETAAGKQTKSPGGEASMQHNFNLAMGFTGDQAPAAAATTAANKAVIDKMQAAKQRLGKFIDDGRFDADHHYESVQKRLMKLAELATDIEWNDDVSKDDALRARKYLVTGIQQVRMVMRKWASEKYVKKQYQSMIDDARAYLFPLLKEVNRILRE